MVYEALTRIEAEERAARAAAAYRPLVYICSPYAGDVEKNTFRARAFSRFAVERHCIPIAPHLLCPQYLDEETERWLGLKMCIVFMGKCEEVWVFGDTVSEGMAAEIEKPGSCARRSGILPMTCGKRRGWQDEDRIWKFPYGEEMEEQ